MNSFTKKTRFSLWVAIFVYFLLSSSSTPIAHAQFGLFDTVWTMNGLPQDYEITVSPNDSLLLIWTYEKDTLPTHYFSRFRLFKTISQELIWDTVGIGFGSMLQGNKILSWDSNSVTIRDLITLEPLSSTTHEILDISNSIFPWGGISEVDTSVYVAGYNNNFPLKGVSYKVNYRTGNATNTSNTLPYYTLTISEDGQYVAGVYYERRNITEKDSYYEILEVRRISDYSVVFYKAKFYQYFDYNFYPYNWATNYIIKISKDNKFIALNKSNKTFQVYNINTGDSVYGKTIETDLSYSTFLFSDSTNVLFYFKNIDSPMGRKMCLLNCETAVNNEYSFPNGASIVYGVGTDLLMNNKYIIFNDTEICDSNYQNERKLADASLLSLNFDINSIQEPEQKYIGVLYPNPAEDYINIDLSNYTLKGIVEKDAIRIFDIYGKCALYVGAIHELPLRIDVYTLPVGVYFVRIGNEKPLKFVKI